MEQKSLAHEAPPAYQHALQLLGAIHRIADTEHRSTNERLKLHSQTLLEHTAALGSEKTRPSRARRAHYARLALAKLAAAVDAARIAQLISDLERAEVRERLITLEGILEEPAPPPQKLETEPNNAKDHEAVASEGADDRRTDRMLSIDELLDLRHLAERDTKRSETSKGAWAAQGPGS